MVVKLCPEFLKKHDSWPSRGCSPVVIKVYGSGQEEQCFAPFVRRTCNAGKGGDEEGMKLHSALS